ncbi:MAG: N-6 DNA methylase [Clostridia bacterium]|nr:N-6 DNA methylase [Lachnospiraceae bacterium]MEE0369884.1 N-6 DNA methylase [Clostridia bacterium]
MLGAIIGDTVGSRFEWHNHRSKDFDFLTYKCEPTDDSIMTLAIAKAILKSEGDVNKLPDLAVRYMQKLGRLYPDTGYGGAFRKWIRSNNPKPYGSFGNGAAMRVSPVGFAAGSMNEAKAMSKAVTKVTHNHPEGLKGAEATTVAIFMALHGKSMLEIRDYIDKNYYPMNFTLDGIRNSYQFSETCQDTVPQAMMAFFESTGFEDAIRNAISIGGDSDTIAAITGGIAEAYYGIPSEIRKHELTFLDERLLAILVEFENKYKPIMEKKIGKDVSVPIERDADIEVEKGSRESMMEEAVQAADKDTENAEVSAEETSSQKLFNFLYEDCNILRGPINQDEYKSYVTPILFFKRLSDVYDEEHEKALKESGGDEEYASFDENYSFVIPKGCHWNDVRNVTQNVGQAIVKAMSGIERANPDYLSGVFSSFDDANWTDKNKLSDERLKNLIEHMSELKVGNNNYSADVMGDAYEYLIKKFADLSKKNAGEFYTPRTVVKLMVMLLDPQAGDTVYDPACGTGGMLIEAIRHIDNDHMTYGKIYGQEKNLSTSAIARMNLFLHGAREFKIVQGDTLVDPSFTEGNHLKTFDCVLANPPFSLKHWGAAAFEHDKYGRNIWGSPSDSNADFAWLQHMVVSMDKKHGRVAVVLPQGVLFRTGKDGKMRKKLVDSDLLEAVITLKGGIFYGAGVSACILFLKREKSKNHIGRVCMIDASEIYTPQRAQDYMSEDDIAEVYKLYTDYQDVIERCKIVTLKDIKDKGYTLSTNVYIEKKPVPITPPSVVRDRYYASYKRAMEYEKRLRELLKEGGYIDE